MRNPLKRYIEKNGETHQSVARALSEFTGKQVNRPQITSWCNDSHKPNKSQQALLALVTKGGVTPRQWDRYNAK